MMAIVAPSKFLLRSSHETSTARKVQRSKSAALKKSGARNEHRAQKNNW